MSIKRSNSTKLTTNLENRFIEIMVVLVQENLLEEK